jgi:hypothetical protein
MSRPLANKYSPDLLPVTRRQSSIACRVDSVISNLTARPVFCRAVGCISTWRKVIDFQGYDVATAQLAIDGDVKQRQIARSALDLELGLN